MLTQLADKLGVLRPNIRKNSQLGLIIRRFRANRLAVAGLGMFLVYLTLTVIGPMLATKSPTAIDATNALGPPTLESPMGTDRLGRDVFARVMVGFRISMIVAVSVVGFSTLVGVTIGLISGFYGGWIDEVIMRVVDVFFAFPTILLALIIVAILGPGLENIILALGVSYTVPMTRIARASALSTSEEEYVMAADSYGERTRHILFKDMLPNMLPPIIVQATIVFAYSILVEASLSYLGLSTSPETPSWGVVISEGQQVVTLAPWTVIGPGIAIMIAVLGLTFLGVGLRDAFDPKTEVDMDKGGGA